MKPPGWYIDGPNKSLKSEYIGPTTLAILDGCLLGDGSYVQRSGHTASFSLSQCAAHAEWVEDLHAFLHKHQVTSTLSRGVYRRKNREFAYVKLWTHSLVDLLPQRARWYPNGKKIIPADLDLSNSTTLAHWHMGDGNTVVARGRLEVKLHTNGFTEGDARLLLTKLAADAGLHGFIIHWRGQPIVTLQHRQAEKFIDLVKPHMSKCFGYKVPANPWQPPKCVKCKSVIGGLLGQRRYVKYCNECASPRMRKLRSLPQEGKVI